MGKEDLITIGKTIKHHRDEEIRFSPQHTAIARANCTVTMGSIVRNQIIWLSLNNNARGIGFQSATAPEISIAKNTPLGGAIIMGKNDYIVPKTNMVCHLNTFNLAEYTPCYEARAKDVTVHLFEDGEVKRYQTINDLINDAYQIKERIKKEEEEKKRIEEEKLKAQREEEEARKAAQKAKEEERIRLEKEVQRLKELRKQKEEEERKKAEEIARLEASYQQAVSRAAFFRNFIREESSLRLQHILDPSQEEAKRSHFYDDVPIVIEGGPGTGKTTTMIQRLKFLLDANALREYETPLKEEQINQLVENISEKWLFFSPTPLLLRFSLNNMNEEGLSAVEGKNVITIDDFRKKMLSAYHLYNMDTNGPFRTYKQSGEKPLIWKPEVAIKEFEKYCIENSVKILLSASELNTSEFSWHKDSFGIKAICKDASKVKDIEALMRLFNSLYEHEYKAAIAKEGQMAELIKKVALELQNLILKDETITTDLKAIFKKWDNERIRESVEAEEDEMGEIKVSAGKETNITKAVKVYELSQVKGMEFEVAFFYDLDEALKGDDKELMKRHLYVGISRASSHLAAIFNDENVDEDLLEYFTDDVTSWRI